jgi:sulfite reductase (ferredoxin)
MQDVFQLPPNFRQDLDQFRHEKERFERGDLSAAEFRSLRVPRGIYEQRQSDTYMLRVRFPAGIEPRGSATGGICTD